ncbi:MAG TPA: hypothetical protein VGA37_06765 [Gemmatimonadales bacterium]
MGANLLLLVLFTVQFQHELQLGTVEIYNERPDGMLTPESEAEHAPIAKQAPHVPLGRRRLPTKSPRDIAPR